MGHNQLQIARQVLQAYTKRFGRQEASGGDLSDQTAIDGVIGHHSYLPHLT